MKIFNRRLYFSHSSSAVVFFVVVFAALFTATAKADESASGKLKLIELYTSHACSSCPAAEKFLSELLNEHADLLALEFHVDYWNDLVHGSDGNFVDPYSKAAFSMRQRDYNNNKLKGRPGVYTPQAIINGRTATVGSNKRNVKKALSYPVEQAVQIHVEPMEVTGTLSIRVAGSAEQQQKLRGTNIMLASYIDEATTRITGGENSKKTLTNKHIVTDLKVIGEVSAESPMMFSIPQPEDGEGCVIFVQENAATPVFAAFECP